MGRQDLTKFGFYCNGVPYGFWWQFVKDGGTIVGHVDSTGKLSGDEIVFLYPDLKTGLMGHFEDGQLTKAQAVELQCVIEENKLLLPLFSEPEGPIYRRELSDFDRVTSQPLLPDPYENVMVESRPSNVPGANDGLFSRQCVQANTVLAFYNGIRREPKNSWAAPDWVVSGYRIFDPSRKKGSLDIPTEYRVLENYCATLAHKTNHSFLPSAEFEVFEHPCYGLIPCLVAITDIDEGEEIFVHYGYGLDHCPDWYADAWANGNYPVPESFKDWQNQVSA